MSCGCGVPEPALNPRALGDCVKCGKRIDPRTSCTDETVASFFDGLEAGFPVLPDWLRAFREHAERRERAGRERFRQTFHGRDNAAEGQEEAADLALYALLDTLVSKRAGADENMDVALTAAYHAARAHHYLAQLRARRLGAP